MSELALVTVSAYAYLYPVFTHLCFVLSLIYLQLLLLQALRNEYLLKRKVLGEHRRDVLLLCEVISSNIQLVGVREVKRHCPTIFRPVIRRWLPRSCTLVWVVVLEVLSATHVFVWCMCDNVCGS